MNNFLEGLRVDEFDKNIAENWGLDEKDTWNLDKTMLVFLYQKLNHYKHVTNTDMEYHTFTNFNLKEVTELEIVEEILEDIRVLYNDTEDNYHTKNITTMRVFHNIGQVFHNLWW